MFIDIYLVSIHILKIAKRSIIINLLDILLVGLLLITTLLFLLSFRHDGLWALVINLMVNIMSCYLVHVSACVNFTKYTIVNISCRKQWIDE